ncbi:MAG TPA: hypothetical protein VFI08_04875 [Spirochaetia bacterium]|nr:hypothetical protein [Spirochaetia bacterium]
MSRRIILAVFLVVVSAVAASALPSTFLDSSSTDGFLGVGVMVAYDVERGSTSLAAELFFGTTSRIGVGLTWLMKLPSFDTGNFSIDGLYWYDPDSTGYGAIVVPVKVRLGFDFGRGGSDFLWGVGVAAGVQDYAFAVDDTGDLFLTLKAMGEIDYWSDGHIDPLVMAGSTFEGTTGTSSDSSGYVIYYYY